MATFISHPFFGAGAAYILYQSQSKESPQRFIVLSTLCQWLPDIDTLSYLLTIDEQHSLGHRGFAHSGVFALALAFAVMTLFYRPLKSNRTQWWGHYLWFFLMTLFHGIFDALVDSSLGIAFFWPFDTQRYQLSWQPLVDVPIRFAEFFSSHFWHAQWIECQIFSFLLASLYVVNWLWKSYLNRPITPVSAPMEAMISESSSRA
jgi:inner membrane protein